MRKLIYAINATTDGCCDHTKNKLMVPYWPDVAKDPSGTKVSIEFAKTFVSKNEIVFSQSSKSAEDKNTKIDRTNLQDEIVRLKHEQGKDISVGAVSIPSQLIALGLVDESRYLVQPIVAGEGRRLMEGVSLPEKLPLRLVESKILKLGSVAFSPAAWGASAETRAT